MDIPAQPESLSTMFWSGSQEVWKDAASFVIHVGNGNDTGGIVLVRF